MKGISYKKYLVWKAPKLLKGINTEYRELAIKQIAFEDIEKNEWLREREKPFKEMLKEGHIGLVAIDKETNKPVAYGWIAANGQTPDHIPGIPKGAAWLHFQRVKDEYKGLGYQRIIIYESLRYLLNDKKVTDIYIDTTINNIPSRINIEKLGFTEEGVYRVISLGTRRVRFCYNRWSIWNRYEKHPQVIQLKSYHSSI